MLNLIWGLLNIGTLILFFVLCFKTTKIIRKKVGLVAAIFFVLFLFSFMEYSSRDESNKNSNTNWNFATKDSLSLDPTVRLHIDLEENLVSENNMVIIYGKSNDGLYTLPIQAYSSQHGFICGTNWKPQSISVNRTANNNEFRYFVRGIFEWKLLWFPIYTQIKYYKGIASLQD